MVDMVIFCKIYIPGKLFSVILATEAIKGHFPKWFHKGVYQRIRPIFQGNFAALTYKIVFKLMNKFACNKISTSYKKQENVGIVVHTF